MGIDERINKLGHQFDEMVYALDNAHLKALKNKEANLRRMELACIQRYDWDRCKHYSKQLGHVLIQEQKIYRNVGL